MPLMPQSKAVGLYVAFGMCVVMSSVPVSPFQSFSFIFSSLFMMAMYRFRKKWPTDSLEYHHVVFIIRTFWIWSLLFLTGLVGAGILIYQWGDMNSLKDWAVGVGNQVMAGDSRLEASLQLAINDYFNKNFGLIIGMLVVWLLPAQLYVGLAIWKGMSRAQRGYRI